MKITIIDGQGGRIGKTVIEQIKTKHKDLELYAIGTNTAATAAMLKAGADSVPPARTRPWSMYPHCGGPFGNHALIY